MFNLGILGFSVAVGTPTGLYLTDRLKGIYYNYKSKEKLRNDFKAVLEGLGVGLKIHDIGETNTTVWGELEGNYKVYKLNMAIDQFLNRLGLVSGKFTQMEEYIYFRFMKVKEVDNYEPYKFVPLPPTTLLLGYGDKGLITADMKKTPHMLITGLSGQGKTGLVKTIIKNIRGADIVLLNGFENDFKEFKNLENIKGETDILRYLVTLTTDMEERERPLYIFIEELATIKNKQIINIIQELLCVARHYNIFITGIIQIATKEELKFKSYFNCRCSFRQLDESSYKVVLGVNPDGILNKREFYVVTDGLIEGKTFTI